jgi:glycosyltransferase involved in cell wall biosynthesis
LKAKQKILITTGIYPPKIGGPAQYAKNLKEAFEKIGHKVSVKTYGIEDKLPTGIRHLFFFFRIIPSVLKCHVIFILDTFSVGLPSVYAAKIFGKKAIIRTGGDFLWEQYVERTGKKILLRNFYDTEKPFFSFKEKIIFKLTKWTLDNTSKIIFSTDWQRNVFIKAYDLNKENTCIVENYYGPKQSDRDFESKTFVASARNLVWKNFDILKKVFEKVKIEHPEVALFTDSLPYLQFVQKISKSYAVILVSLGDISPNMILDSIRCNKPFICTKEVGIYNRIKDAGIFANPLNEKEIEDAILKLLTEDGYREAKGKVINFNFVHTWDQIAQEFLEIARNLKK